MQTLTKAFSQTHGPSALGFSLLLLLSACSTGSSDSVTVDGDVAIAYVKRPTGSLGNPTDAITFTAGGDLYMREKSSPSAAEINITGSQTNGQGDVSDPEVSFDGKKLLFTMRRPAAPGRPADPGWRIWEYDIGQKTLRGPIACTVASGTTPAGDDVDPAYLPDGRIVFVSNRQVKSRQIQAEQGVPLNQQFSYLDEYERERVTALHVMDSNGGNCHQISYNQSHDRNPTVLQTGEIMYSRWDHVGGRNQFSIFTTNPDGTGLFVMYGAHSPGNSYLHPRELPNKQVLSTLMPLSRTNEGGALMQIDIKNYSENGEPAPGVASGGNGQHQPTAKEVNFGQGISEYGRFSTPYPLWDGTNRALVSWAPSCAAIGNCPMVANPLTGVPEPDEGTPVYGAYMLDLNTRTTRPVVTAPPGYSVLDPVAIQPRPLPLVIEDKTLGTGLDGALISKMSSIGTTGVGVLNVKSVYDTDSQGRMGDAVLVSGESIPKVTSVPAPEFCDDDPAIPDLAADSPEYCRCKGRPTIGKPDLCVLKNPAVSNAAQRPARFIRITKAVPTQSGISREAIGETEFEMQQILGYTEVEPDGSFKIEVPADIPIAITAIDKDGRGFTPHTNWIQVRPGETRTCNGCHSPRRGSAINSIPIAGNHPNTLLAATLGSGESMAETRAGYDSTVLQLKTHMSFTDVWTNLAAPAVIAAGRTTTDPALVIDYLGLTTTAPATTGMNRGVIDYPTHIQPLWTKARAGGSCEGCHSDPTALDLSGTTTGTGRLRSYDELLIGDPVLDSNGLPTFQIVDDELRLVRGEAQVNPGTARGSHLIEVLFNQELKSDLVVGAGQNHSTMLNASEKRLVSEWIDLGAQYYNSPRDSGGALRGVTGLSETVFNATVHPILLNRCAACHQAVGLPGSGGTAPNAGFVGMRFVLTGQAEGDFNVTLSMVGDVASPATTELLRRPASTGTNPTHGLAVGGGAVMPVTDPDYITVCNWINITNVAGACQ